MSQTNPRSNNLSHKQLIVALGSGSVLSLAASLALLRVLEEYKLVGNIQEIWGCSAGAIVGSLFALGMPTREIHQSLSHLKRSQITDYNWKGFLKALFTRKVEESLLKGKKLHNSIKTWIKDSQFSQAKIPLRILAHRLDPAPEELVIFKTGRIFDAMAASTAMPGLFPPFSIGNTIYCDPTSGQKTPILAAAQAVHGKFPKPLIISSYCGWSGGRRERNPRELFGNLLHAKELLQWELTLMQLDKCGQLGVEVIILTTPTYAVGNLALDRFGTLEEACRQEFEHQLGISMTSERITP